jgi:hypothetical protein
MPQGSTHDLSGDVGGRRRRQNVSGRVDHRLEVCAEPRNHQKSELLATENKKQQLENFANLDQYENARLYFGSLGGVKTKRNSLLLWKKRGIFFLQKDVTYFIKYNVHTCIVCT